MHTVLPQQEGLTPILQVLAESNRALEVAHRGQRNRPSKDPCRRPYLEPVQCPQNQRRGCNHRGVAQQQRTRLPPVGCDSDQSRNPKHRVDQQCGELRRLSHAHEHRRQRPTPHRGPRDPAAPRPDGPETECRCTHIRCRQASVGDEVGVEHAYRQGQEPCSSPSQACRAPVDRGSEHNREKRRGHTWRSEHACDRAVGERRLLCDRDQVAGPVVRRTVRRHEVAHKEQRPREERLGQRRVLVEEPQPPGTEILVPAGDVKPLVDGRRQRRRRTK